MISFFVILILARAWCLSFLASTDEDEDYMLQVSYRELSSLKEGTGSIDGGFEIIYEDIPELSVSHAVEDPFGTWYVVGSIPSIRPRGEQVEGTNGRYYQKATVSNPVEKFVILPPSALTHPDFQFDLSFSATSLMENSGTFISGEISFIDLYCDQPLTGLFRHFDVDDNIKMLYNPPLCSFAITGIFEYSDPKEDNRYKNILIFDSPTETLAGFETTEGFLDGLLKYPKFSSDKIYGISNTEFIRLEYDRNFEYGEETETLRPSFTFTKRTVLATFEPEIIRLEQVFLYDTQNATLTTNFIVLGKTKFEKEECSQFCFFTNDALLNSSIFLDHITNELNPNEEILNFDIYHTRGGGMSLLFVTTEALYLADCKETTLYFGFSFNCRDPKTFSITEIGSWRNSDPTRRISDICVTNSHVFLFKPERSHFVDDLHDDYNSECGCSAVEEKNKETNVINYNLESDRKPSCTCVWDSNTIHSLFCGSEGVYNINHFPNSEWSRISNFSTLSSFSFIIKVYMTNFDYFYYCDFGDRKIAAATITSNDFQAQTTTLECQIPGKLNLESDSEYYTPFFYLKQVSKRGYGVTTYRIVDYFRTPQTINKYLDNQFPLPTGGIMTILLACGLVVFWTLTVFCFVCPCPKSPKFERLKERAFRCVYYRLFPSSLEEEKLEEENKNKNNNKNKIKNKWRRKIVVRPYISLSGVEEEESGESNNNNNNYEMEITTPSNDTDSGNNNNNNDKISSSPPCISFTSSEASLTPDISESDELEEGGETIPEINIKKKKKKRKNIKKQRKKKKSEFRKGTLGIFVTLTLLMFYLFACCYFIESDLHTYRSSLFEIPFRTREIEEEEKQILIFYSTGEETEKNENYNIFYKKNVEPLEIININDEKSCIKIANNLDHSLFLHFPVFYEGNSRITSFTSEEMDVYRHYNTTFRISFGKMFESSYRIVVKLRWVEIRIDRDNLLSRIYTQILGLFPSLKLLRDLSKRSLEVTSVQILEKSNNNNNQRLIYPILEPYVIMRDYNELSYFGLVISLISLLGSIFALRHPLIKLLTRIRKIIRKVFCFPYITETISILILIFLISIQIYVNFDVFCKMKNPWHFPIFSSKILVFLLLTLISWQSEFCSYSAKIECSCCWCICCIFEPCITFCLNSVCGCACLPCLPIFPLCCFPLYWGIFLGSILGLGPMVFVLIGFVVDNSGEYSNKEVREALEVWSEASIGISYFCLFFDLVAIGLIWVMFVWWKCCRCKPVIKKLKRKF